MAKEAEWIRTECPGRHPISAPAQSSRHWTVLEILDRLAAIMQPALSSSQPIVVSFSGEGIIQSVSAEAGRITGYSVSEISGRPITQILADPSVFEIQQAMAEAVDWGTWEGEIAYLTRSGRSLRLHTRLLAMAQRACTRSDFMMLSTAGDGAGATMEERGLLHEMASRVRSYAHEINNPLAVVMGFTQLILLNPQCSGKVRADVERMYAELGRVIRVVDRLHKYSLSFRQERDADRFVQSAAG